MLGFCFSFFLIGIPCLSSGGVFIIDVIDYFGVGIPLVYFGAIEMISLAWIYGYKNVSTNVEEMVGSKPKWYLELAWAFFSPVCLIVLTSTVFLLFASEHLYAGLIPYPSWAMLPAKTMCILLLAIPPVWAAGSVIKHTFDNEKDAPWRPTKKFLAIKDHVETAQSTEF